MSQFIETIRIEDGTFDLIEYHNERFNATRKLFFCVEDELNLEGFIQIPKKYRNGIVKCRIIYDIDVREVQFSVYKRQKINTLKLVNASIKYPYKSTDRIQLEQLKALAFPADEILIVKNGKISDTSYSNIIFGKQGKWFTSDSPLLAGVRREYLLNENIIKECEICPSDLNNFDTFMLINAMMKFDEQFALPIKNILTY